MPPLDLTQLAVGQRVQHELLVLEREERRQPNGDPFVILTLGNSTGRINTAPIWSNQLEWVDGTTRGRVVQVIGQVATYARTGKRQLQLTAALRLLPEDSFNPQDFLPCISTPPEKLWDWVDRARTEISSTRLRNVLALFFGDDDFRVRFERTPGSTTAHHSKIGGLLEHVVEVASIAKQGARVMRANVDLVVTAALLHDIGKVEAYQVTAAGFEQTPAGLLIGHVVLGALMLDRRLVSADAEICTNSQALELQHLILSHHGSLEFGSPVVPATLEADIVHWADQMSAKANDVAESLADPEAFGEREISEKRMWRAGRYLWRRPHDW
jgi:3'-5' exoribonuclease